MRISLLFGRSYQMRYKCKMIHTIANIINIENFYITESNRI